MSCRGQQMTRKLHDERGLEDDRISIWCPRQSALDKTSTLPTTGSFAHLRKWHRITKYLEFPQNNVHYSFFYTLVRVVHKDIYDLSLKILLGGACAGVGRPGLWGVFPCRWVCVAHVSLVPLCKHKNTILPYYHRWAPLVNFLTPLSAIRYR